MFLGRNTQQWLGLIAALTGTLLVVIPLIFPAVDVRVLGVALGSVGGFLGVVVAFVANTYTTPAADPQIVRGTMIRVSDETGRIIDHQRLTLTPPEAPKRSRGVIETHSGPVQGS